MYKGTLVETLSWKELEPLLQKKPLVVLPLGAASKQHGYHLQLRNDWLLAEYLKEQVLLSDEALVFPTINYSYYPAFAEYPGSVSLSLQTAASMIEEICRSIAVFGPRCFYILNTGISTFKPIALAAESLSKDSIKLSWTDLKEALEPEASRICSQEGGSHADEIETSMMLYIAPDSVRMELASSAFNPQGKGPLSRLAAASSYSESGVWGDARLADRIKGQKLVKCLLERILLDLSKLRSSPD